MDIRLSLTPHELRTCSPFHTWTEFTEGFDDQVLGAGNQRRIGYSGLRRQAYDLGAALARSREMTKMEQGTLKWLVGDLVEANSGKVYRIEQHRDPSKYRTAEWSYSAVQIRAGKPYGPVRVMTDKSFKGLAPVA